MTFKSTVDQKAITDFISEKFGNEFNADAIRAAALEFGLGYPTIRKLSLIHISEPTRPY